MSNLAGLGQFKQKFENKVVMLEQCLCLDYSLSNKNEMILPED